MTVRNQTGLKGRPKHERCGQEASTFAEVLVAVLVLGLMIFSLYASFFSGFTIIRSAREDLRATQILLQRIEAVRLFNWNQILDTTNYLKPTFVEYYDPLGATNSTLGVRYSGSITSSVPTDVPGSYQTNMRAITLTLNWTNYNGSQRIAHTRQMQTRVARYGMQNYIWGTQ